jgi:CDP-diacylglycerol--glycerol-3-phosphate 3-phosphatidyltransferase
MALVPVFIVFYYLGVDAWETESMWGRPIFPLAAFLVFAVASATDAIDGYIARRRNQITNFGKLMDPLADKILTATAFILFAEQGIIPAWMVIIIIAREFAITGLRGVAASEGTVIPAGGSGKLKTVLQMAAILLILLVRCFDVGNNFSIIGYISTDKSVDYVIWSLGGYFTYAAVTVTLLSGIEYLWKGRKLLNAK